MHSQYIHTYTVKNLVYYLTLRGANHTFIRVISTPTVPYNTPLMWYALCIIFYSVAIQYKPNSGYMI